MSNILYQKLRQQYSLDGGATWNYVYNAYKVGNIIENPSNCTSTDSKQYRWVELPISEGYTCDPTTYTKYTVEVEEVTYNGGLTWTRTGNQRKANVYEENSVDCGYSGSTSECSDRLSFEFSGSSMEYKLNYIFDRRYTATTSPYSTTLAELGIDTLTNCYQAFKETNITKLTEFPCTNNVTSMTSMFEYCTSLTSVDVSKFNTSNVTRMDWMFYDCSGLTSLDVSNFDTSNVKYMGHMFFGCDSLTSLDVSNFNTSNVTDMDSMFAICRGLTSLDLSSFDTSNVTNMEAMFAFCNFTTLDLSNWDMTNVTKMSEMFKSCTSLTTIKMIGCNQTTRNKITSALTSAGLQNQVTIIT